MTVLAKNPINAGMTNIRASGREALGRARTANAKTQHERDYIAALDTFYKDAGKLDHWERARAYAASMEGVSRRYPQDQEGGKAARGGEGSAVYLSAKGTKETRLRAPVHVVVRRRNMNSCAYIPLTLTVVVKN